MVNPIRQSSNKHVIDFTLSFDDPQAKCRTRYTTEKRLKPWCSHRVASPTPTS